MGMENFYRGDTVKYDLTVTDEETGDTIDLSGSSIWFTLKTNTEQADAEAVYQTEITTHIDAPNGLSRLVIPSDATTDFPVIALYYDFQLVTSGSDVYTLEVDKVKVLSDITRTT